MKKYKREAKPFPGNCVWIFPRDETINFMPDNDNSGAPLLHDIYIGTDVSPFFMDGIHTQLIADGGYRKKNKSTIHTLCINYVIGREYLDDANESPGSGDRNISIHLFNGNITCQCMRILWFLDQLIREEESGAYES